MESTKNEISKLTTELEKKIKKFTNYRELHFFNTSIFNLQSIISAISQALLELYPKSKLI